MEAVPDSSPGQGRSGETEGLEYYGAATPFNQREEESPITGEVYQPLRQAVEARPQLGEEREEAVRPDRGLSAGPSSCRLVTLRAATLLLSQPSEHQNISSHSLNRSDNTHILSLCPKLQPLVLCSARDKNMLLYYLIIYLLDPPG